MIIITCHKCGSDLSCFAYATNPPINAWVCSKCIWSYEEKEKIKTIHASIGLDEEKMWNDPEARVGKTFHYDLKTQFELSESQMKALLSIVLEFRKERPCFEHGFRMEKMVEE